MRPGQSCYLFGAYKACIGIRDAAVLFHSVAGCNVGTLFGHLANDLEDVRQAASVIYEPDIVYGGGPQLAKALREMKSLYPKAALLIVISGCIPNMIGDDIKAEIKEAGSSPPILHIMAAGTAGSERDGYEAALLELAGFIEPKEKIEPGLVNILGLAADDFRLNSDLAALKKILGAGLVLQSIGADCTFCEFRRMAAAELNIVFGRGVSLAEKLKNDFGTPYIVADYPYGLVGMKKLQEEIAAFLPRLDYRQRQAKDRERLRLELKKIPYFLNRLYGLPVAIVGDGVRTTGLRRFLAEELGLDIVYCADPAETDFNVCYDGIRKSAAIVLFGSSFERGLAAELGIPLFPVFYPVFDEISLGYKPFLGVDGILNSLEYLINACLKNRHKPRGAYANFCR